MAEQMTIEIEGGRRAFSPGDTLAGRVNWTLEHDPTSDGLFAVGTQGAEQFDAFFAHYAMKLTLEYGNAAKARAPVEGTSVVRELTAYCRNTVQC